MAKQLLAIFAKNGIFSLLLCVTLLGSIGVNAQVSSYTVTQSLATPAFGALTGQTFLTTTTSTPTIENGVFTVALPSPFNFNGTNYSTVYVSVNGFVTFGAAPTDINVTPISSTEGYAGAISVFGQDLDITVPNATLNNLSYVHDSTNGIMKFQWGVRRSNNPSATPSSIDTGNVLFQLWLYLNSSSIPGTIDMQYNTSLFSAVTATYPQVGLRGATNADYKNLWVPTTPLAAWPAGTPGFNVGPDAGGSANNLTVNANSTARILSTSNRTFRWVRPTCSAPTGLAASQISHNSVVLNWNAASPAPANGYEYYVGTTSPTGATAATGSVGAGVLTSGTVGSLASNQTYYIAVRSVCSASDKSTWLIAGTFTTYCAPVNVTYYEGFEGTSQSGTTPFHGAIPACTYQNNVGTGNPWVTADEANYSSINMDFQGKFLMYNGQNPPNTNPANTWFFTSGINMTAGTTYRLSYLYAGTSVPSTVQNKMKVALATAPLASAVTTQFIDHPDIKGGPFTQVINFTAPTTGVYYIGFNAYSLPNNGQFAVDDITVALSICLQPTAVSVANISATTAQLSWTAPSPAPSGGYAYYVSTSATAPTNSTVPTGFTGAGVNVVTLTGLTGSTNYYFWVRTNCGGGDFGEWVALDNAGSPFFTTLVPPPAYCVPSGASFAQDPNGITNVTMGTINNTTGIETNNYGNYTNLITNVAQGQTIPCNITLSTGFTYDTNIWVDWNNDGDFADAGELVYQGNSTNAIPTTLNASFTVPLAQPLGPVRLRIGAIDFGPFTDPCRSNSYQAFEDYTLNVVVAPPAIGINITSSIQCAGDPSPLITLSTPIGNFNTYTWSPAGGVTGNATTGYTISSNTTLTYTLTGVQTSPPFSTNSVTFQYNANTRPTPITLTTPSGTDVCVGGTAVPINSSGGLVSGFPILSEGFNGATNAWTVAGSGSGSPIANWTLRPNNFNGPLGAVRSNDNTQFYFADSDEPGSGTAISTTLTSPAINTVGYTNLSLSFWHCYRYFSGDTGKVQVSTNGTTWTDLAVYSSNQGTLTAFTNVVINLDAYVNQATLYVRFAYDATWDWFWAIDNVLVSGTASSSVTWTPVTGLYYDAAATSAYIAGTGAATVYALPTANTTYVASASTSAPVCTTTSSVTINVNSVNAGTASSNQTICSGSPANLTLTGFTGSVVRWQSSTNLAFTTPVDIPASASATLTSAQMGALTATTYYRAVVTNAGCTGFSNVVTITVSSTTWTSSWSNGVPSLTKAAIFAGNYSSTGNLSACSVTVQSGDVVFNTNHTLTVENAVNVVGGTLTFEDDSSLLQNANVANSGNITYKRNTTPIRKFDYTYWSSPVAPQTLVALSPLTQFDKYYSFDTTTGSWVSLPSASLMVAGKGYIIRGPNTFDPVIPSIYNASFVGVPNNGTIQAPIVLGATDVNLIGNPYPSALNIDLFMDYNGDTGLNLVDKTIYIWTHNTAITNNNYTNSDYAVYNYMGGVGTSAAPGANNAVPSGKIASGQSFFIKGLAAGNAIFNNSMRVAGNNAQFFRAAEDRSRLWLQISDGGAGYKQTLVGYADGATNGIDSGYDGDLFDAGNVVALYSLVGTQKLTIQGRALPFSVNDVVPLGYKATETGNLTIGLYHFDGDFTTQNVYLKDNALSVVHDLKAADYTFTTLAGTFDNRFELIYTTNALGVATPDLNSSVIVYAQNQVIHVQSSQAILDTVEVFDVRGAKLASIKNIDSNAVQLPHVSQSQQLLFVKVTDKNGATLTRKIQY